MTTEPLIITREAVESGDYEADKGVIILIAPEGVPTVRHIRALASKVLGDKLCPQGRKIKPNENIDSSYKTGPLTPEKDENH